MKSVHKQIATAVACIFLAIGAFFMANVQLPWWSGHVSAANIILFAVPAFWVLRRWLGWCDGVMLFASLGVYALLIETAAIITGFPYGHFGYSDALGYRILGYAPWTVAFAWAPLMLGAFAVAAAVAKDRLSRIALSVFLLTAFDLVLDPGAVFLKFWQYENGGWYYGVPWTNFAGWLVSSLFGALILETFLAIRKPLLPVPAQLQISALFILYFWSVLAVFAGLWLAAATGTALLAVMLFAYSRAYFSFDEMIVYVDDEDRPVSTERKSLVHTSHTKLHRAFSVFLFDGNGKLLLQQRAFTKVTWPGVWSNSCCGHSMLHESVEDAAVRRTRFELGVRPRNLFNALPDFRYRAELDGIVENEICPVLVGVIDGEPQPNPDEVAETKWIGWKDFIAMTRDPSSGLSPWCVLETEALLESAGFRKWLADNVDN